MEPKNIKLFIPINNVSHYGKNNIILFNDIPKKNCLIVNDLPLKYIPKLCPLPFIQLSKVSRVEATFKSLLLLKINPLIKPYLIFIGDKCSQYSFDSVFFYFIYIFIEL